MSSRTNVEEEIFTERDYRETEFILTKLWQVHQVSTEVLEWGRTKLREQRCNPESILWLSLNSSQNPDALQRGMAKYRRTLVEQLDRMLVRRHNRGANSEILFD